MIGIDTNVLARFLLRDDPVQSEQVTALFDRAGPDGLFVTPVVLIELDWVLRRLYRIGRAEVLDMLDHLVDAGQVIVGEREVVIRAITLAMDLNCGFADAMIVCLNSKAGCTQTVSFDRKALRLPGMQLVKDALT